MKVVVMGAWNRDEVADIQLVGQLLDSLVVRYGDQLIIVTAGCDRGVGKLVKNRAMPQNKGAEQGEFAFIEVSTRIFIQDASKSTLAGIFIARNATLVELGEEFHLFLGRESKGAMQDLVERVERSGIPFALYQYREKTGPKVAGNIGVMPVRRH
jgi:hypothetical protein